MGRPQDPEKAALLKELGFEDSNKNWSKKELLAVKARRDKEAAKVAEKKAIVSLIAGDLPSNVKSPEDVEIPYQLTQQEEVDPFSGLNDRQKMIARLRMRGLSQSAIAKVIGVSQPIISKELARIKEWQIERGASVDQAAVVGNTVSLYEEIEHRAWEIYHSAQSTDGGADKAKALSLVMTARDKHTKLLMDLGLLKRAANETKHTVQVSPFMEKWNDGSAKKALADSIVTKQLSTLAEPTPDPDWVDAEFTEEEEEEV
ncbi:helix-turn-helix domain-containing protein [bacterium]|nr:helix-turn-helix domain-containing protein [bacterium]